MIITDSASEQKTLLVTGGAGFLGSHLCEWLLDFGHRVIALDDLSTGTIENIDRLTHSPNFRFIEHDVTAPFDYQADGIFHLASPASPVHYQRDPLKTIATNVLGAMNVLTIANKYRVPVLLASTSEVYGDPLQHPQFESDFGNVNPIGVRACYDESKRLAETLFFDNQRMHGTDIRVARIFNTYGERMRADDGRVVSNFIVQALTGKPITVNGDGRQTRSFCYVADTVAGLIDLMQSGYADSPVNIGNPVEISVMELAQMVIRKTKSKSELVFNAALPDDPSRRRPDIGLAQSFGWQPIVEIADGLDLTIEYFAEQLGRNQHAN